MNKPLWAPSNERIEASNLSTFDRYLKTNYKLNFKNNYEELWKWSVSKNSDFWPKLIKFLDIKFEGRNVLEFEPNKKIYDQIFFKNLRLNYAENILTSLNDEPIIFRNEIGFRRNSKRIGEY